MTRERLLELLEDPGRDPFRVPLRLSVLSRYKCAVRAWRPLT